MQHGVAYSACAGRWLSEIKELVRWWEQVLLTENLKAVIMTQIIVCLQHENKPNLHALTLNKEALINLKKYRKKPTKKQKLSLSFLRASFCCSMQPSRWENALKTCKGLSEAMVLRASPDPIGLQQAVRLSEEMALSCHGTLCFRV